jgi:hypothetical protein
MLAVAFFRWWYGPGWRDNADRLRSRLITTYLEFSVPILVRTLFSPWRRIISYGGGSLGERARSVLDNIVSRFVGFGVRLTALLAAVIILGLNVFMGGLWLILWPLIPVAGPILILRGLLG